ncbi:MAG TPA: ASKHA domain-containing protein, partial [Candidatus Atribacteria bacterium]|nr:ASKHA domain-containing protein [Candidatus Atribacteria bacterium]
DIVSRLRECSGKPCFLIAAKEAGAQRNIYIAQKDIREVQLAKAAIMAGIKVLLHECKADYDDIETVYLAGGFGNYIDMDSATAIGLIPVELRDKIVPIGNGALTGAKLSLKSSDQMAEAGRIYKLIRYVELSSRPDFQDLFVDCMELV